ncbi:MAG: hypothetical protein ACE5EM_03285 [Sphingomonadales bacterium]
MDDRSQKLPNHEELLLDYTERLKKHRQDRRALHVRLSQLARHNRQDHHLLIAEDAFDKLIKVYSGQIFRLWNHDLVFIGKNVPDHAIDDIILKLRFMFREDPFIELSENETKENAFCVKYDIEKNYSGFLWTVREWHRQFEEASAAPAPQLDDTAKNIPKEPDKPLKPFTAQNLDRLERAIECADLSTFAEKQPVCAMAQGAAPKVIFYERFISLDQLRNSFLPDVNFLSNRWLCQRLLETLDRRLLAFLPELLADFPIPTSINLTVATALSEHFRTFNDRYRRLKKKKTLIFEFHAVDIFADISAFLFARDVLHGDCYKICIDGLDPLTFCMIFREQMQVDMEKVVWSQDLLNKLESGWRDQFAEAVERAGPSRVVLCEGNERAAVDFGRSMGIHLFQGQYIDQRLNDEAALGNAVNF